jgi:hypothetical protein
MQKVTCLGPWYVNGFIDGEGKEIVEETSQSEYEALALSGAGQPSKEGCEWFCSCDTLKFDTPTGKLREGEYAEDPNGGYWIYDKDFWFIHSDNV